MKLIMKLILSKTYAVCLISPSEPLCHSTPVHPQPGPSGMSMSDAGPMPWSPIVAAAEQMPFLTHSSAEGLAL